MISNKKILFFSILALITFVFSFSNLLPAQAEILEEILDEIARIEAQLQDLRGQLKNPDACVDITFQRNLKEGMSGFDVKCLQAILNVDSATQVSLSGPGSSGNESNYLGSKTTSALIKFQEKYAQDILTPAGLTKGTGFVGPKTIAKLNFILSPPPAPVSPGVPTVSLSANFSSIASGRPVSLSWASFNTTKSILSLFNKNVSVPKISNFLINLSLTLTLSSNKIAISTSLCELFRPVACEPKR